ncbi:MAG: hypothetical protein ACXW4S_05400 [Candidatus Deferrimicrobiaceae bacterium]
MNGGEFGDVPGLELIWFRMLICTCDPELFVVKVISPSRAFRISSSADVRLFRKSAFMASVWFVG